MILMKLVAVLSSLMVLIAGCVEVQTQKPEQAVKPASKISGVDDLLLNEQDLKQIGMSGNFNNQDLAQLGIIFNETPCKTEQYQTDESSPLAQYSICSYTINSLDATQVVVELKKFTNLHDLNGSYQYESLHLRSSEGIISENDYGDMSRFYINNDGDYGAEFNNVSVSYYSLYIAKNEYLIHVTSKGSKQAKEYIVKTGEQILSKFS